MDPIVCQGFPRTVNVSPVGPVPSFPEEIIECEATLRSKILEPAPNAEAMCIVASPND